MLNFNAFNLFAIHNPKIHSNLPDTVVDGRPMRHAATRFATVESDYPISPLVEHGVNISVPAVFLLAAKKRRRGLTMYKSSASGELETWTSSVL